MSVNISYSGIEGLDAALKALGPKLEAAIDMAVVATALEIRTDIQKRIQSGSKTGRLYKRSSGQNLSAVHRASAPGEAPATDAGVLVASIEFSQPKKMEAVIGSRLVYARYLEDGTANMRPRPAWTPAAEAATPKLIARIETAIKKAMP